MNALPQKEKRKIGRPARIPDRVQVGVSLSRDDRDLLSELGGSMWIRDQLARARKNTKTGGML